MPSCRLRARLATMVTPRSTWLVGALLIASLATLAPAAMGESTEDEDLVTVRGKVICVDAQAVGRSSPDGDPCESAQHGFALATGSGERLSFYASDPRALMFEDPRVRERLLEIRGFRRPGNAIEIVSIHSIVGGERHRIHYRCDVCNIDATAPGPCWCCGEDFELRETPVEPATAADRPASPSSAHAERDHR